MTKKSFEPILLVVSAPSGAGKTTLCRQLLKDFPNSLELSISTTTRPPRGTEKNGVEYHFVSVEDFKEGIEKGHFAEYAKVHDRYYGTSKSTIERSFQSGKSVLLDIDVQGAASLRESYGNRCYTVFVAPPSIDVLEKRLRARGTETEEAVRKRILNAHIEIKRSDEFDYILVNDTFERAYQELKELVEKLLRLR